MDSKPFLRPRLVAGKHLATVRGFVAAMNWAFAWLFNLKAGPGVKIVNGDIGSPQLKLNITAGDGVKVEEDGESVKIGLNSSGGTQTLDVITGVSFSVADQVITATFTKKTISVLSAADAESASADVLSYTNVGVVTTSDYDSGGSSKFYNRRLIVGVIGSSETSAQHVFTTVNA